MDDIVKHEPKLTLEHRIKNLEAYISSLKEEQAALRKEIDSLAMDIVGLQDSIFD